MNAQKTTFLILFVLNSLLIFSKPVDEAVAKEIGVNYLNSRTNFSTNVDELDLVYTMSNQIQTNYFYVFNVADKGYVIVSADDDVYPIIGYSDESIFITENIPVHVMKWLENYRDEIRYVVQNNISATNEIKNEWEELKITKVNSKSQEQSMQNVQNIQAISPLVQTKWNQSPFVNELCPFDTNQNQLAVTGCVATAMAQIMKYWSAPTQGSGFHSYNHLNYGTLSANFGATTYNWAAMPNIVNNSNIAVATLMYHCGVAVEMNYGTATTGGSSAYVLASDNPISAQSAYTSYFGFNSATIQGLKRSNYTDSVWLNILKGN